MCGLLQANTFHLKCFWKFTKSQNYQKIVFCYSEVISMVSLTGKLIQNHLTKNRTYQLDFSNLINIETNAKHNINFQIRG